MSVKVELIGVGVIMVVDTEINTVLGGMKMMVLLMYPTTVIVEYVLLASMILTIGVVNVGKMELIQLPMNVLITQTTPIMSVIIMIIITIIIMEMTITMKLTMIM